MNLRRSVLVLILLAAAGCASRPEASLAPAAPASQALPAGAPHDAALKAQVDVIVRAALDAHPGAGVAVGLLHDGRTHVRGWGRTSAQDAGPPDGATLFEIGSISKVLSGLLLAAMVEQGGVAFATPVEQLLPWGSGLRKGDQVVTLLHLATHSAGLPMMPDNWITVDKGTYTPEMLRAFVGGVQLLDVPGRKVRYSNVGFGLLGEALGRREGTSYEALLNERVIRPLGMTRTALVGSITSGRRAVGHDESGAALPDWKENLTLAACCCLESSVDDLMKLLRAEIDLTGPLGAALRLSQVPWIQGSGELDDQQVAMGWFIGIPSGVFSKGGNMRGYRSAIAFDRSQREGVVVLASAAAVNADEMAFRLLREIDLARAPAGLPPIVDALPVGAVGVDALFDGEIRLLGWTAPATARRGDSVDITFFYGCDRRTAGDWRVFVHGDAKGLSHRIHGDHYPPLPTARWKAGEIVRDTFALRIPADFEADAFTVWSGFHDSRRRMRRTGEGPHDAHDRVRGPRITVLPR